MERGGAGMNEKERRGMNEREGGVMNEREGYIPRERFLDPPPLNFVQRSAP